MDPINIIAGLNLIATFGANVSGAKRGLRSTVTAAKEKPESFLQKIPLLIAVLTLLFFILAIFQVGTFSYKPVYLNVRIAGLLVYLIFSWIQVWAFKTMGENYSQEVLIYKHHKLVTNGPFKFVRHPQYLSQILLDIGAGASTLSFLVIPLAIIEIPILVMRSSLEEKLLEKHFKEEFLKYKSKSGCMLPFIG